MYKFNNHIFPVLAQSIPEEDECLFTEVTQSLT